MNKKVYTSTMIALMAVLLLSVGAINCVHAQAAERMSYMAVVPPTIDGMWTSEDEWTDTGVTMIGEDANCRSTWEYTTSIYTEWLVEVLSDTTDDAGDYWEFCVDGYSEMDSAPQTGDFKFVITGHTDLVWYEGDGTGWTEVELADEMIWAATLSESPTDSTPHWILEFQIDKAAGSVLMDQYWNLRIAVYDASNSEAGEQAWPPESSADAPDTWGMENYTMDAIPEGFSFGIMVLLSSAAVAVTTIGLRKRIRSN
jgi:hypothetical protein